MKNFLLTLSVLISVLSADAQNCNQLFYSEYVEGSVNNKAIEIYNPTANPISLSGYTHVRYSNGSTVGVDSAILNGTIPAYGTWVLVNPGADPALLNLANQTDATYPAPTFANGDDALVLKFNGQIIDIFGEIGYDPGTGWSSPAGSFPIWTTRHTLFRKANVLSGVTTNPVVFDPIVEWDSLPKDNFTGIGSHTCNCNPLNIKKTYIQNLVLAKNPVSNGLLEVFVPNNSVQLEIIDLNGKIILKNENLSLGFQKINLNQPKGIYIIKAISSDLTSVQKLIID